MATQQSLIVDARVSHLRSRIEGRIRRTWKYQDAAHVHRTPTSHAERHTRSLGFLRWDNRRWRHRQALAHRYLVLHRLPSTGDWVTAVRIVQRVWPGTESGLLACSSHEGGHGIWVWNGGAPYSSPSHGSGAGGWMQYMSGTFWGNFHNAVAAAPRVLLPPGAASWTSPLGQAFAAGWAFYLYEHGAYPGSWPWRGDGACA